MNRYLYYFIVLAWLFIGTASANETDFQRSLCVDNDANQCISAKCPISGEIDCSQNCRQMAEQNCKNTESNSSHQDSDKFKKEMCKSNKANLCINVKCPNSGDIHCQPKCRDEAEKACSN